MADEAAAATATTTTAATAADATATQAAPNVLADAVAAGATATEAKADGAAVAETKADAAGDKGADAKADEADKPIEYTDFTLPEGAEVDAATLGEAKTLLAGMKLPQDQAQKLVDFYAGKIKSFGEAQMQNWAKLQEKWVGEFKADEDIGGDRATDTISAAAKAMDRFGTPGLREALIATGAGNHPEVIRFVASVGKAIAEDRFVVAGGASAAQRSTAETLYPNQGKEGG